MKAAYTRFVMLFCTVMAVATAMASHRSKLFRDSQMEYLEKKLEDNLLRDTGINWTWLSWIGGPTCPDNVETDLEVSDINITSKAVQKAFLNMDILCNSFISELKAMEFKSGIGLGITYNGKVIYKKGFGTIDKDKDIKPAGDTIFSIGSVTKIFVSHMLMNLVEKGIVNLDDPVSKFYNEQAPPVFAPINPYGSKRHQSVTLRSLATHTSGLPREPSCTIYGTCTEEELFDVINKYPLQSKPLTTPHYSNLGTALLSHCLERAYSRATGRKTTFEEWFKENIFDVIGMPDSGFNVSESSMDRMAVGYEADKQNKQVVDPTYMWKLGWSEGCGGMYSTLDDMLAFIGDILKKDESLSLGPDAYEYYTLPGINFPDGLSSFGLGTWESFYANGYHTLTKGGLVGGFGTSISLVPSLKLGVVTWVNLMSGSIPDQINAISLFKIVPAIVSELSKKAPEYPLPPEVDDIVGSYSDKNETYFTIEKQSEDQKSGLLKGKFKFVDYDVYYIYDKEYTEAIKPYGDFIGFRVRRPSSILNSCTVMASGGVDKSIFYIEKRDGNYYATSPDLGVMNIPKDKK